MFEPFNGTLVYAVDGDSVWVNRDNVGHVKVRVGGVDVPSSGVDANMAKALIDREWSGVAVHVRPTATYLVHGEIPGIVTTADGRNSGLGVKTMRPRAVLPHRATIMPVVMPTW